MKGMRNRTASEVVVISSDDENDSDLPTAKLKPRRAAADSLPTATCDLEQPAQEDGKMHGTKKALKPNFITAAAIDLPRTPTSRPRLALARVVSISSSEDDEHDSARSLKPVDHLLYSPVKRGMTQTLTFPTRGTSSPSWKTRHRFLLLHA
ncbi:hypothetical protein PHLGIDRAFT_246638 [Phlebiopsis gigantea 11061_1 CR5-6]|uniref:Uncharacterized protein n=1 Tax=Phlebiopsis gigantea (strain 11061_1 CR5-6) TaxID=745531 RepID=A0A0C3S1Q9_PHLG1|nr:hypothetical protein PHLGIDRAFT_246638 [Phlebiopsis gigantea 11061_1 CR5-6]